MCPIPTLVAATTPAPSALADFSLTFPPEPRWVHAAREAVRTALAPLADSELLELAALLTSELVTNAVTASLATLTPIALHGEWIPTGAVRVLVHDRAPGLPLFPDATPHPEDEHGRGLLLLTLLATDWGVCHHLPGPGKIVWCTLGGNP